MHTTTSTAAFALLLTSVSAGDFYIKFFSDRGCQTEIASPSPSYGTGACNVQSPGAGSFMADFTNFTSAYYGGAFYTDNACADTCGTAQIMNEGPSAEWPIANGQCVAAPPVNSDSTWNSWRIITYR